MQDLEIQLLALITKLIICIFFLSLQGSVLHLTKADRCDVCRRNSRACQGVRGEFTKSKLPGGYNYITQLPTGVCNINITELGPSSNYIGKFSIHLHKLMSEKKVKESNVYHTENWINIVDCLDECWRECKYFNSVLDFTRHTITVNSEVPFDLYVY